MNRTPLTPAQLPSVVAQALAAQPITDLHTHLYPPTFGTPVPNATGHTDPHGLMLWGVDELVTYHYLIAEVYRVVPATKLPYAEFWRMSKSVQADHIWKHLFVERTPVSEACRGVLTTLHRLGYDVNATTLDAIRNDQAKANPDAYIDRVMELSHIDRITMTNAVFDDNERVRWEAGIVPDSRFDGVLRIDPLLCDWPNAAMKLDRWGYAVTEELTERTKSEIRRFLGEWIDRINAVYVAVSLPPDFRLHHNGAADGVLAEVLLPLLAERDLPFAMMIGARRGANPDLRDASDTVGLSDVRTVTTLCREFPKNRFFVTMLARENQHELAVVARKFGNLMLFGCWWFLNNPSLIDEITRMRMELLGTSFVPQHSDARVLDQLIYKWEHSRAIIGNVMVEKYRDLMNVGRHVTHDDVAGDAKRFLKENYLTFRAGI